MIGIGVDVVDIVRFRRSLERTPTMRTRLFTRAELDHLSGRADDVPSLAARFGAREAVMKAMGLGLGAFGFHDVSVEVDDAGAPSLLVTGAAATLAADREISRWLLSLSHDGTTAVAMVVAT